MATHTAASPARGPAREPRATVVLCRLDKASLSPLSVACEENKLRKAQYLLDERADVNGAVADAPTRTPLMLACARGHADIVSVLLQRGADFRREVTLKDGTQKNALQFAMEHKGPQAARCIELIQEAMRMEQQWEILNTNEKSEKEVASPARVQPYLGLARS